MGTDLKLEAVKRHTELTGRTALITGGTKGIGRACAEEMAVLGAKVLICSRNEAEISETLDFWKKLGLDVHGIPADVSQPEGRAKLVKKADELFGGKINIVLNNVGTNIRNPTAELTDDQYHTLISTNLDSAFLLTKALYPLLKAAEVSSVIMISSIAGGPTTVNSGAAYAATKAIWNKGPLPVLAPRSHILYHHAAALDQFCRYTACEWAKDGIRVNSIKPGYIETPLVEAILANKERAMMIKSRVPMRRVGQPGEIAGLATFLASDAALYMTGQCIAMDGGFSAMGMWPIDDVIPFPASQSLHPIRSSP